MTVVIVKTECWRGDVARPGKMFIYFVEGGGAHPLFAAIAANRPVRLRQKAASTIELR